MLQCFEFHDKHGRNRRKERICFDHEQVRDQNKCVLRRLRPCCHEIQSIGQLFRGVADQPRCVVGPRVSPAYFKLTAWIAANVYAYVHGHTRTRGPIHAINYEISSKTLSTSSLTINAPLIVKDEVDKDFRTYPFTQQNKKSYVGLRLIVIWDPPVPGPLKGPGQAGP